MLTGMMGDIGWIHTWIHHDSLVDMRPIQLQNITALIQSDTTISAASFYLHNHSIIPAVMIRSNVATGNPNEYSAELQFLLLVHYKLLLVS